MSGETRWQEVHRRSVLARQSKLAISLDPGLSRKTVRRLLELETWRPYARAPQAVTLLTPWGDLDFPRDSAHPDPAFMHRLRPRDCLLVWLALYGFGVVCVPSFVVFEMPDVDGSDPEMHNLKTPATPGRAGRPQSTAEAVRRAVLQRTILGWLAILLDPRSAGATAFSAERLHLAPAAAGR